MNFLKIFLIALCVFMVFIGLPLLQEQVGAGFLTVSQLPIAWSFLLHMSGLRIIADSQVELTIFMTHLEISNMENFVTKVLELQ